MARAISSRRSRGTFSGTSERSETVMGVGRSAWGAAAVLAAACSAPKVPVGDPQAEIAGALARSAVDWNRGDLAGFMRDYARDSLTNYGTVVHAQYGRQSLNDRYQNTSITTGN